jgi:ketosteroid isomerase-like protein
MRRRLLVGFLAVAFLASGGVLKAAHAGARIQLPPQGQIHASSEDVKEIEALYNGLEDALAKKDIDAIMSFYADDYDYQHANKAQVKYLWSQELPKFDSLYSVHNFSEVTVQGTEAAITCTGVLFGLPTGGADYVVVDSWQTQPHYLTKKDGHWKIVGGATHWVQGKMKVPGKKKETFTLEFHPFF